MMNKTLFQRCIVLLFALTACTVQIQSTPASPTISNHQTTPSNVPTEEAFALTKLFAGTAEEETQVGVVLDDATMTAIVATKFALNTQAYSTEATLPTDTPYPLVPPGTPPCRPSSLKAQPYGSMGAAGTIALGGGIVNISRSACYLQAWPVFWLVDAAGRPLDVEYEPGDETYSYLLLLPGQSVSFMFAWGNWCGGEVVGGVTIRVFLPDQSGSIDIPPGGLNSPVSEGGPCDNSGAKSFINAISNFQYETNQP